MHAAATPQPQLDSPSIVLEGLCWAADCVCVCTQLPTQTLWPQLNTAASASYGGEEEPVWASQNAPGGQGCLFQEGL